MKKILEIGKDYIIYLDDKDKVKMRGFNKYQVIRNKDKIIFLDKSDIEIRKEILEYKFNGNYRIKVNNDYIQIDNDFRVMLDSAESRYRLFRKSKNHFTDQKDFWTYLCVQPKGKVEDIEIKTSLGIMCLDPKGALIYAKVLFLLDIRKYAKGDYWIKQQFKDNRYKKYLE